jgi:hypothetical protein
MAVDVKIFRHELATVFRLSRRMSVHPSDIQILEHIDGAATLYEEENETVFLARDVVQRLCKMTTPMRMAVPERCRARAVPLRSWGQF